MINDNRMLFSGFMRSCEKYPDRPALEVDNEIFSYRELYERAACLAATLEKQVPPHAPPFTAVLASRSCTAFTGIMGILLRGYGCVPLNPNYPPARNRTMLQITGCRALIVDSNGEPQLDSLLSQIEEQIIVLLPESQNTQAIAAKWPNHIILGSTEFESCKDFTPQSASPDSIAYILFTSGSTGIPKGVILSHSNMIYYINIVTSLFTFTDQDRFAQMSDLTWDVSTFEMFVAWEKGACVCCPDRKTSIHPGHFLNNSGITVLYVAPSVPIRMKQLGMLKPNQYPQIRLNFFGGESLPNEVARAWHQAAPQSLIINAYGPTEVTVTCSFYCFDPQRSPKPEEMGEVPIGLVNPGLTALIVDESLQEVPENCVGELLVGGPQVTLGYWNNPEKTKESFVIPPGHDKIFYRTGDRVRKPVGNEPMIYLGRFDNQVQIHGFRVELGEIEFVLREEANVDIAVALGWPITSTGVGGIVAFIQNPAADLTEIYAKVSSRLPKYMVPKKIIPLSEFPLNPNRKIDRKSLLKWLQENPI